MKVYRSTLTVRGYELDSYAHVNHAVYFNYLEHARWEMLAREGIDLKQLAEWQRWPVIAGLEAQYLKPTFLGDVLEVRTWCEEPGKARTTFVQEIHRGETLVFKARVNVVIVNEKGRPADIPPGMARVWSEDSGIATGAKE